MERPVRDIETAEDVRELLGPAAEGLSDERLLELRDRAYQWAFMVVNAFSPFPGTGQLTTRSGRPVYTPSPIRRSA